MTKLPQPKFKAISFFKNANVNVKMTMVVSPIAEKESFA
jgi:hypothetical protein